jgi:hypothetical protein
LENYRTPAWNFCDRDELELQLGQDIEVLITVEKSILANTKSNPCLNSYQAQGAPKV